MEDLTTLPENMIVSKQLEEVSVIIATHSKYDPTFMKSLREAVTKSKTSVINYETVPLPDGTTGIVASPSSALLDCLENMGFGTFGRVRHDYSNMHLFTDEDLDEHMDNL